MKSPPVQHGEERARQMVEAFIATLGGLVPVGDGAARNRARGDEPGMEDVHRPAVSPAGSLACCT